ncbi:MAG TPA: L-rhamnose/proton symporter RhaT [Terriglobales bacterium]
MSDSQLRGFSWLLVAGTTGGAFVLPMKFVRRWKWEHTWLVYSILAFFIMLPVGALLTVPKAWQVYQACSTRVLLIVILNGAGWGAGSVLFGLGVDALGMALGFSMMTGIYTALGTLVPLAVLTPDLVWTQNGLFIIAGNLVTIVGVVFCAIAGDARNKYVPQTDAPTQLGINFSFPVALTICILAGVFSAMLNFAFAFGSPMIDAARQFGYTKDDGANVLWLLAIVAGGILNVGYCFYLFQRNKNWSMLWRQTAPWDWFHATMMAVLWTVSLFVYGWGANDLGRLGPALGWSLWNAILILTTFACGWLTHEWKGAPRNAVRLLLVGIVLLLGATVLLGLGGAGA